MHAACFIHTRWNSTQVAYIHILSDVFLLFLRFGAPGIWQSHHWHGCRQGHWDGTVNASTKYSILNTKYSTFFDGTVNANKYTQAFTIQILLRIVFYYRTDANDTPLSFTSQWMRHLLHKYEVYYVNEALTIILSIVFYYRTDANDAPLSPVKMISVKLK